MRAPLIQALRQIIAESSGLAEDEFGNHEEFVGLGLDSLFLTQLAGLLQNRYGVPVTFKQLVNQFPTVDTLAAHLEANGVRIEPEVVDVPVDSVQPLPQAQPQTQPIERMPAGSPVSIDAGASSFAGVFVEQLRLMEQQLVLLRSLGDARSTGVPVTAPVSAPAKAAIPQPTATSGGAKAPAPKDVDQSLQTEGFGPQVRHAESSVPDHVCRHIEALAAAWNQRTAQSKASTARYRDVHADPRTAAGFNPLWKELVYPVVVERAEGARLTDIDGNDYIDLLNGFGPGLLGHNPKVVVDALRRQIEAGFPIGPQTPLAGEVVRLICELTGNERATLVNTGSEAVAAALRVARTVTGRDTIVVFDGDYHGNFDEVLVRAGRDHRARPMAPGIPSSAVENVVVLPAGSPQALAWIAEQGTSVAAVLVEPVQSRFPENRPREFMRQLREITAGCGACLIFDEVITGFRAGLRGAQGYYGVQADLVTYGKVVGGGLPIGVVAGKAKFMDTFDGGTWRYGDDSVPEAGVTFIAGTFVRHPLAVAAAHAVLTTLKAAGPRLYEDLDRRAAYLANALNQLFITFNVDIEVVHFASQLWLRIGQKNPFTRLVFHHVRLRGVYIQEGFPTYLTTAHTDEHIDAVIDAFRESVLALVRDRVLEAPAGWDGQPFPLASDQQDLWIASELDEGASCAYNESDSLWLTGELDHTAFIRSWSILTSRHQVFHLRVNEDGSSQTVMAGRGPAIQSLDFSTLDAVGCEQRLQALYAQESDRPFDLRHGPLHRAFLVRHADDPRGPRHQFVLYAHHLVHDGWTANVLFEELAAIYNALRSGDTVRLQPPLAYAEFLASRSEREATEATEHVRWWQAMFAGSAARSSSWTGAFPADHPVLPLGTHAGATHHLQADPELSARLVQTARQCRVTQHTLMLGAFVLLSARQRRSPVVCVGVPRASQAGFEGRAVAGMGVKLLPLCLEVNAADSVEQFLQSVRTAVMDAQEHGVIGYSDLLRQQARDGVAGQMPTLDAIFNFSHYFSAATFDGLDADVLENPRARTHFRSFMHVTERQGRIDIDWDYSTETFKADSIQSWSNQFVDLLDAIAADSGQAVGALIQMEAAGNPDPVVEPVASPVLSPDILVSIRAHLEGNGERTAIESTAGRHSWAWLDRRSGAIAAVLKREGIVRGDTVAIATERSADMIASMLAVLRIGASYLPVDQNYPEKRIAHVLSHSGVKVALVDAVTALVSGAGYAGVRRINVADIDAATQAQTEFGADGIPEASSPAYVIYTSGSTGLPKGVVVSRGALANYVHAVRECPGIFSDDRVLAQTTIAFDIHVTEIWATLAAGATLVLATQEEAGDGDRLRRLVDDGTVTVMQATPATWRLLKQADWTPRPGFKGLIGGEAAPIDLVSHFVPRLGSLWNMYGPTEATVWASCCRLVADGKVPPIGKPLPGYRFHVLDDDLQPVPSGMLGQLAISGVGLATGYHRDPEKTAQLFPTLRFDGQPVRVYLTGDLVVAHPDGNFVFHARKDNQIKLRGHRIEPGEIEHAIHATGQVNEAVVLLKAGETADDAQLVAFVVMKPGVALDLASLRKTMAVSLPRYMLPSRILAIGAIPKTDNGKIDRRRLIGELDQMAMTRVAKTPPASAMEALIADLWREQLGPVEIGRDDSFFDAGGHSLMTVQFLNRLKERTGVRLRVRDIVFEDLQGIAARVESSAPVTEKRGLLSRLFG